MTWGDVCPSTWTRYVTRLVIDVAGAMEWCSYWSWRPLESNQGNYVCAFLVFLVVGIYNEGGAWMLTIFWWQEVRELYMDLEYFYNIVGILVLVLVLMLTKNMYLCLENPTDFIVLWVVTYQKCFKKNIASFRSLSSIVGWWYFEHFYFILKYYTQCTVPTT